MAGIVLAVGAFAVFAGTTRAWAAVTGAHAVALAGVLWGMVAIAAGRGPHTQLNDTYHRVTVVLLGATLILLLTPMAGTRSGGSATDHPVPRLRPTLGAGELSAGPAELADITATEFAAATVQLVLFGACLGALAFAVGAATGRQLELQPPRRGRLSW